MRKLLLAALVLVSGLRAEDLFNGRDLAGWELITTPAATAASACHVRPNGVLLLDGKPSGYLQTTATHANYRLHVEWRWPGSPGNGGILLHIASGPKDRVWPLSLQVQTKHKYVGDLLPMAGISFGEPLAPGLKVPARPHIAPDSEKPAGEWNTCDVVCRGDTVEVTVNGVVQNRITSCSVAAGHIGFQFEGVPYELRHLTLTAL
ncbi:MAG: DUF1080 domain-containing protein [Verrucomicrobia bacterium]|nr:DUF1080 domain-containing protein [Verrucomicrobiota bacterium]